MTCRSSRRASRSHHVIVRPTHPVAVPRARTPCRVSYVVVAVLGEQLGRRRRRSGRGPSRSTRSRSRTRRSASNSSDSGVPSRSGTRTGRISTAIVASSVGAPPFGQPPRISTRRRTRQVVASRCTARVRVGGARTSDTVVRSVLARQERVGRVPQEPDAQGLQVLRAADDVRVRTGRDLHRRPQRLGQVERRRRARLGHGRAGREDAARRQDGGRHLRRHRPRAARSVAPR